MFNFRYLALVGCLLASFMTPVHAEVDAAGKFPTEIITIGGTLNINIDPEDNGSIPFGRYVFTGSPQYNGPVRANGKIEMRTDYSSSEIYNINDHKAIFLGYGFYATFGIRDDRGDIWSGATSLVDIAMHTPGEIMITVFTEESGTSLVGDFSYNKTRAGYIIDNGNTLLCAKESTKFNYGMCAELNINVNIHVAKSACHIITTHNMAFTWTSLSPSEISNGSAESKTAPVTMRCGRSGAIEPIAVSFTSSEGTYDADQGIVKTNLANLGLQLTWASNGQPVVMDKEINFPALSSSTQDLSVNAKPVQLGSTSVGGGSFSTRVTMNIEYR